jgi:predicted MFS family arabinose efflux permease
MRLSLFFVRSAALPASPSHVPAYVLAVFCRSMLTVFAAGRRRFAHGGSATGEHHSPALSLVDNVVDVMIELLKDRIYLRYWLSVVISFLGDAMTRVTLIYVGATLTDSPAVISLIVLSQLLPSGVLGAFVGPLADRLPARVLMIGSDLARVPVVLAMIPVLDSVAALVALILLEGVAKAVFETARITAVPRLVAGHSIPAAVGLFQSTSQTVNMVGPALGGLLIASGDIPLVLVLNAATFVLSALLLRGIGALREAGGPAGEPYWQALRTGVSGVLAIPSLRFLMVLLVPVTLVAGLFTTGLNAQLLTVFDLPPIEYGAAQAVFAGGSIAGALAGPLVVKRFGSTPRVLLACVAMFGLVLLTPVLLGAGPAFAAVAGWCLLTGLFASLYHVPTANTMLRDLPEELRGRGVGLLNTVTINFTIAGVALGGPAAAWLGVAGSLVAGGVVLLVSALAFLPAARRTGRKAADASR